MVRGLGGVRWDRERRLILWVYFLFYYGVLISFVIDHRLLSQIRPAFFQYNRDLTELAVIGAGLTRWMIANPVSFLVADGLAFLLPLLLLVGVRRRAFGWLSLLFVFYVALYWLLADIFWQVHHEPFIFFVLLPLAFAASREDRGYWLLRGCRYYFLYVFVSAAVWKIARGAVMNPAEMSHILIFQHDDLLSGDFHGWAFYVYSWLIDHPVVAQALYLGGVALEACFVIGFFTRRYDRLLLGLAVLFVVADLVVMRIPYWTLLVGGVALWLDDKPRPRTIVVYETTHHENLPALLDLCETRFTRVVVFLKDISYQNIQGSGTLAGRWPATEFVVQPEGRSNRQFIRGMFRFMRRERCSHLHLSTLDNNLLLFAMRLCASPAVQVSLTVHEVNEYFRPAYGSLRDTTETMAKALLRKRIGHYTFFLPAMAERFRQRMPAAVAVFLPSRFYAGGNNPISPNGPFTIVLPGSVDENRRDYEILFEVFRSWTTAMPRVMLVLLGDSSKRYGAGLVARLWEFEPVGVRVRNFSGYVPESVYEKEIGEADLLWSPLRVTKMGSRDGAETYGITTASGLTADILLNNVPALVPRDLMVPEPFNTALLPYASAEEATALLRRLVGASAYRQGLRQNIHAAFSYFVKSNFSEPFALLTALPEGQEGGGDAVDPIHKDV